jgi:hypothetical protein
MLALLSLAPSYQASCMPQSVILALGLYNCKHVTIVICTVILRSNSHDISMIL